VTHTRKLTHAHAYAHTHAGIQVRQNYLARVKWSVHELIEKIVQLRLGRRLQLTVADWKFQWVSICVKTGALRGEVRQRSAMLVDAPCGSGQGQRMRVVV